MEIAKTIKLSNGIDFPTIGFGTWKEPDDVAVSSVKAAIAAGYRIIDTAKLYKNEGPVGQGINEAIAELGVKREDLFVTTKLWNRDRGYDNAMKAFDKSMSLMGLEYIDMYMLHWPAIAKHYPDNWDAVNLDSWKALTQLYKDGRVKAIGVCNFFPKHLESLMQTEIAPMVNQIEFHPGYMQKDVVEYCQKNGIVVEAWSPLGSGAVVGDERLKAIADKYGKDVGQLCIRFCMQNGIVPLPKSATPSRIVSNLDVYDFSISDEDMAAIKAMPEFGFSGWNPDEVDF